VEQAVLTRFIEDGHFSRHISRMRMAYMERQSTLLKAACDRFECMLDVRSSEAGLHLIGWLPPKSNDTDIAKMLLKAGIECPPLSRYTIKARPPPGLLLGYAAFTPQQIVQATRDMAAKLQSINRFAGEETR
jgi:GntR family transcriptional regulator/MocR family aminotransferase